MLVYFARHGQTDHNKKHIIQGQLDTQLNEQGRDEAAILAEYFRDVPFVEVRTSDLSRAFETANIVAALHDLTPTPDAGIRERALGSLEGVVWTPSHGVPADAEQTTPFRQRVGTWFKNFLATHTSTPSSAPVLVISHGAYLSNLVGILVSPVIGFSAAPGVNIRAPCPNTSFMRVQADYDPTTGKWKGTVLSWGEAPHLGDQVKDLGVADDLRASFRRAMAEDDK